MSVLENMRKGTDSTSTRVLIGVVVAVFIFWGAGSGSNQSTSVYATINGVAITDTDFRRTFAQAARASGRNLSDEEAEQLKANVITSLIQQEAITQEASRLGITVSPEELQRDIQRDPNFKGEDDKFDPKLYERILKAQNMNAATWEEQVYRKLLMRKIADLVSRSVSVPPSEVRAAFDRDETKLELAFVRLPTTNFLDAVTVSDADRDAFVTQNADKIKARYDESYDRFYNLPKRYQLRTILLRTDIAGADAAAVKARLEAVRAEAAAGADFESLAKRWSEDLSASNGGQLGIQPGAQLDPAIVAAADKAGVGKVTEVVETSRGLQILLVEKVEDAKVISLDEARNEIAVTLLQEQGAPKLVEENAGKIISAWTAAGAPPADLLSQFRLTADTTGEFSLGEPEVPRLGDDAVLRQQLATAKAGYVIPTPMKLKGATFVVAVTTRTEPDPAAFELAKTQIEGRLRYERESKLLEEWVTDVVSRAKVERPVATQASNP